MSTQNKEAADNIQANGTGGAAKLLGSTQDVLLHYTHCSACHSRLHFTYVTDFSRNLTQETARCPECHLESHKMMHRLQ